MPNTTYEYRIAATDAVGVSEWSPVAIATTADGEPLSLPVGAAGVASLAVSMLTMSVGRTAQD